MSHTSAGLSHQGNRHVKSRMRTNLANAAESRYPGSGFADGLATGLVLVVVAKSRSRLAGIGLNPG